ncbi:MAG: LysR family transcriptional regulator [Peptococcaceae bacterium]|nr:LysR family transcriptional regulator [Peptococcaceae bacterium]
MVPLEWQQIMGFYHVAKLGSFTRAAQATFRTQSALTQQVRALEEELGCQLFERIGRRKLLLTPAGEKLLMFSEAVLEKHERLVEELNELKKLQKGCLRIAAPFTTLYHLLPEALQAYTAQFPWVELSLLDRPQKDVVGLVKGGDVDFGMALESVIPKELEKILWKKAETVLLAPAGHPLAGAAEPVTAEEISRYPLILPPKSTASGGRMRLEELFRKNGLDYRVVMESSNVELSSLYVEMGLGISFATVVRDLPVFKQRKLELVSLNHYFEPEHISLVIRKDKALAPHKKAFLSILTGRPLNR